MRDIPDDYSATRREVAAVDTSRSSHHMSDWAFLACALSDLHLYREARSALKHVDETGRRHPSLVYLTHGHYHNVRGELRLAESWYRKAAAKDPAALVFLGAVQARRGRLAQAKKSHRMATRAPDSDWLARDEQLTRAYTKRYPWRSAGWILFAQLLAGYARHREAASMLRRAVRLTGSEEWIESPEDRLMVRWGLLYVEKKDYKRAEASFRRAVKLRASSATLNHLADVLIIQGRFSDAKPILRRVLRTKSDEFGFAHYQLGLIARARREYPDALEHFDTALRCDSPFPLAGVARRDVREAMKVVARTP